jgi:hypothetical protein
MKDQLPTFPRREKNIMRIPPRHWLDYDSVGLAAVGHVNQPRQMRDESYRGKQNTQSIFAG